MRQVYPSDISREEFESVRELLEGLKRTTRPRIHDLYDIVCAMLYIFTNRKQWRDIPADFPPWRSVHEYYSIWKRMPYGNGSMLNHIFTLLDKQDEYDFAVNQRRGYAQPGINKRNKK